MRKKLRLPSPAMVDRVRRAAGGDERDRGRGLAGREAGPVREQRGQAPGQDGGRRRRACPAPPAPRWGLLSTKTHGRLARRRAAGRSSRSAATPARRSSAAAGRPAARCSRSTRGRRARRRGPSTSANPSRVRGRERERLCDLPRVRQEEAPLGSGGASGSSGSRPCSRSEGDGAGADRRAAARVPPGRRRRPGPVAARESRGRPGRAAGSRWRAASRSPSSSLQSLSPAGRTDAAWADFLGEPRARPGDLAARGRTSRTRRRSRSSAADRRSAATRTT